MRWKNKRGLTFIEVMVTAVILSVGLVGIYRTFLIAADHAQYFSCRLMANTLIDGRIARIEKGFQELKDFDVGAMTETVLVNGRDVEFRYTMDLKPVGTLLSIFEIDMTIAWQDRGRTVTLSRSACFSGVTPLGKEI
jgi:prepilin-type N-terminal cleavage/methylation domain-containing protein